MLTKAKNPLGEKKMELYRQATEPGFYTIGTENGDKILVTDMVAYTVFSIDRIGKNIRLVFRSCTGDYAVVIPTRQIKKSLEKTEQ